MTPEKRKKEFQAYREKLHASLESVLRQALDERLRLRLRQLELRRDGLIEGGEIWDVLKITDEQRGQFVAVIQPMHEQIKSSIEEARKGGDQSAILSRVLKLREESEGKLESQLTDAQKKQWDEMIGAPVALGVLFGV
jgi:hypothetical protein